MPWLTNSKGQKVWQSAKAAQVSAPKPTVPPATTAKTTTVATTIPATTTSAFDFDNWFNIITSNGTKYPNQTQLQNARGNASSHSRTQEEANNTYSQLVSRINSFVSTMEAKAKNPTAKDESVRTFLASSPDREALAQYDRNIDLLGKTGLTDGQKQIYIRTGDPTYINKPFSQLAPNLQTNINTTFPDSGNVSVPAGPAGTKESDALSMNFNTWTKKYNGTYDEWTDARGGVVSTGGLGVETFNQVMGQQGGATDPIQGILDGATNIFGDSIDQIVQAIKDMFPSTTNFADLTGSEIKNAINDAERIIGPHFTRLKEQATQDFELAQRFAQENLQNVFKQTKGDVETQKTRMSRNLQEAVADSSAAMASRGLTFGGTRKKERGKLETATREGMEDITTNAQRKLEDAQRAYERSYGSSSGPNLEMPDFYSYTSGNEPGTQNIAKQRSLEDLTYQQETEQEREYQTILQNKRYGTLNI